MGQKKFAQKVASARLEYYGMTLIRTVMDGNVMEIDVSQLFFFSFFLQLY